MNLLGSDLQTLMHAQTVHMKFEQALLRDLSLGLKFFKDNKVFGVLISNNN